MATFNVERTLRRPFGRWEIVSIVVVTGITARDEKEALTSA